MGWEVAHGYWSGDSDGGDKMIDFADNFVAPNWVNKINKGENMSKEDIEDLKNFKEGALHLVIRRSSYPVFTHKVHEIVVFLENADCRVFEFPSLKEITKADVQFS